MVDHSTGLLACAAAFVATDDQSRLTSSASYPVTRASRKAPGVLPVWRRKNLVKFVALVKPRYVAIWAADSSSCASNRLASKVTRRSMNCFAAMPNASWVARETVRGE